MQQEIFLLVIFAVDANAPIIFQNSNIVFSYCHKKNIFSVKGSSREFVGFNTDLDESVISHIWKRVGEYFPKLRSLSLSDLSKSRKVRIGLRPYSELHSLESFVWKMYLHNMLYLTITMFTLPVPDGKPVIGPVPGLSNVYLAAGHEGGGLSMVSFSYS
jgi:hypothetical protein